MMHLYWLKHSMSLWAALNSVNTSSDATSAEINFDDTWFHLFSNSLNVYYLNWLITCNNLTQKMYTFRKKTLLKGKNLFKLKLKY